MTPVALGADILLGLVIGIVSGSIGVGSCTFLISALMYFYGISQIKAQGTSVATLLLPIGIFAFWSYYKAGNVDLKLVLLIAVGFAAARMGWRRLGSTLSAVVIRRRFEALTVMLAIKLMLTKERTVIADLVAQTSQRL